jgi:hypothetical protein
MFVRIGRDDSGYGAASMALVTPGEMDVDDRTDPIEDPTMTEIKSRVAAGYEVDAEQVAREILRKLRLVKWARQELASAPGRTPARSARGL